MRSFAARDGRRASERFLARLGVDSVLAEGDDCDFLSYGDDRFVSYCIGGLLIDCHRARTLVSGGLLGCESLR